MEQNPFLCYSIDKMEWRKTCISDSSNPAMAKKIGALTEDERNAVFSTVAPAQIPANSAAQKPQETADEENVIAPSPSLPANESNASKDQKIYSQAVSSNDIMLCEQILETETLKSCLSQVARQTKIPSLCEALSTKDNIDICRTYSQGGDVKG
jgi:hypothetical protein